MKLAPTNSEWLSYKRCESDCDIRPMGGWKVVRYEAVMGAGTHASSRVEEVRDNNFTQIIAWCPGDPVRSDRWARDIADALNEKYSGGKQPREGP